MQMSRLKRIGFLLMLVFVMILYWNHNGMKAEAATTQKFKEDVIELSGIGDVHKLEILNKEKNSTYKWSSTNDKVVRVSNSGLVTAVGSGSAKVKCKITYKSGKTKTLSCNVTVKIPASEISITNSSISNGAHVMMVGETFKFTSKITPYNSTDKVYWSLDASSPDANINAVHLDDNTSGKVTAVRRGKIVLVATAASEATGKAAAESDVKDAIIIEVVGPSAEVVSAEVLDSKTIRVVFGTEIRESTVVDSEGRIRNIELDRLLDSTGKKAADPGKLSGILSKNMRTLTITTSNPLNGNYGVSFSNGILTSEGSTIYKDYFNLSYLDQTSNNDNSNNYDDDVIEVVDEPATDIDIDAPDLASVMLDDNGMTNIITFTEKMDFTNFSVSNAKAATSSAGHYSSTLTFLNNKANYTFSGDGKSVYINMTPVSPDDYDKAFIVTISGLTDTAGNKLKNGSVDVVLRTNTAPMPQAIPVAVIRTSYDTITATFTRSIRVPGSAYVNNSSYYYGKVNPDNNKQVIYTLNSYDASLTGNQVVSVGYWDSYNVRPNDTTANNLYNFNVNFTTEKVRPILVSYDYNSEQKILSLTFSEDVSAFTSYGNLPFTMTSTKHGNLSGNLEYSVISTLNNVVEITLKNATLYGSYTINMPEGFVVDNYRNFSISRSITIFNDEGEGVENKLPEPYSIHQSSVNNSVIYVEFADKLDVATALDETNYTVSGAYIEEVKIIRNSADGATVQLVLKKGTIVNNGKYNIKISGIQGYNGSYTVMSDYSTSVNLIENTDPVLKSVTFDSVTKNTIKLVFSEKIAGNMIVNVQERATGYTIGNNVSISGDTVLITLGNTPADGTHLMIYVQSNNIVDLSGNESTIDPVLKTFVNY